MLGPGAHPSVEFARIDIPFVTVQPDSPWMVGLVHHGDLKENSIYVAPRSALADAASIASIRWQRVASPEDAELADKLAFLLWQFGLTSAQPTA